MEDDDDYEWQILSELQQQNSLLSVPQTPKQPQKFTIRKPQIPTSSPKFTSPLQYSNSINTPHSTLKRPSLLYSQLSKRSKLLPSDALTTDPSAMDDLLFLMTDTSNQSPSQSFNQQLSLVSNRFKPTNSQSMDLDLDTFCIPDAFNIPDIPNDIPDDIPNDIPNEIPEDIQIYDYSKLPSTNHFIRAKSADGSTLYFPKRNSYILKHSTCTNNSTKLLKTSIFQLMHDLKSSHPVKIPANHSSTASSNKTSDDLLWIDKYKPKLYLDLAGDEKINKSVLSWVKQWDYCVFNKPVKKIFTSLEKKYSKNFVPNFIAKEKDPLQRPERRILLLTGPPGLGKTTLAHVIGVHAGYNVIEINASDDRTGDALKNKLLGAIESKHSIGNNKPNLVIIDEIDGASNSGSGDQNFMKLLVDKVLSDTVDLKKSKRKSKSKGLLRPIICICNDPYAPVLRPLRAIAEIYSIKPPASRDLAKRLQDISLREGLKADLRSTILLIDLVEGDMRSAINTLQFLKTKSSILTTELIQKACTGHKDMQKSLFHIWKSIFEMPSTKDKKKMTLQDTVPSSGIDDSSVYSSQLTTMINCNGEFEKLLDGVFENYLNCKITDMGSNGTIAKPKIEQALDWVNLFDSFIQMVNSNQNYEFLAYLGYPIIKFHKLFASPTIKFRVEYPKSSYQSSVDLKNHENILLSFWSGISPAIQNYWSKTNVAIELVPYLIVITGPELKSVNVQVLKPKEKQALKSVVKNLVSFGLSLVQQKDLEGNYSYRMEPPIGKIVESFQARYKNGRTILSLSYPVQQLISQQVVRSNLKNIEISKKSKLITSSNATKTPNSKNPSLKTLFSPVVNSSPAFSELIAKVKVKEEMPVTDFFGRVMDKKTEDAKGVEILKAVKHKILYKFNEGFSNAVRKPVMMNELI